MGMFDSIMVACACGVRHEFQSKSGDCRCETYELAAAPVWVLLGANRHAPICCACGEWLEIDIKNRKVLVVPPPAPERPFVIRLDDGKILDFKRIRSEGGGQFQNYYGRKNCGEFDKEYFVPSHRLLSE